MSDAFEALAEPATPSSGSPEAESSPGEANDRSPLVPADQISPATGEATERDGARAARPKRAPRRSGARARPAETALDSGAAVDSTPEPAAVVAAPAPLRRRRTR